jgi:hypothetical protein
MCFQRPVLPFRELSVLIAQIRFADDLISPAPHLSG